MRKKCHFDRVNTSGEISRECESNKLTDPSTSLRYAQDDRSHGISLIEVVIVIALISILSIFSIININQFQSSAVLDSTAQEFASTIESARSKSIAGSIADGTTASDYESDYLPNFGVSVESGKYTLFSVYRLAGDIADTTDNLAETNIDANLNISPVSSINFDRRTGSQTGTSVFTLMQVSGTKGRQITVNNGSIEIIKI